MDAFVQTAMIGTARAGNDSPVLADHPTTPLVEPFAAAGRERQLLLAAGAAAIYSTTGRQPQSDAPPLEPAPAEQRPRASLRLVPVLQELNSMRHESLLKELLAQLDRAGLLLPSAFLPTALGFERSGLRAMVRPLLGERGRWLSRFRPEWRWAESDAGEEVSDAELERNWTEGTLDQRAWALDVWHRADPAAARRRLEEVWKTEKAETRETLLYALGEDVRPDDEPFLEQTLDDRSATVGRAASFLLLRLPNSQLTQRMTARADAMLSGKTTGLIRKSFAITCTPPKEVDAAWERDGLAKKPPPKVGPRAHWLKCALSLVRPGHWVTRFQQSPEALIAAVAKDDFADAAILGWSEAAWAFAQLDPDCAAWFAPLGEYWSAQFLSASPAEMNDVLERLQPFIENMPSADAERIVAPLLQLPPDRMLPVVKILLQRVPTPWSEGFSEQLLSAARSHLKKFDDERAMAWAEALRPAAHGIPDTLLNPQLEVWELCESQTWQSRSAARDVTHFIDDVRLRRSVLAALHSEIAALSTSSTSSR